MKIFVLFDDEGERIYSKQTKDMDKKKFLNDSKKALERYAYERCLPINPTHVNIVGYAENGKNAEIDEWIWYSFLTRKFYLNKQQALEDEEK